MADFDVIVIGGGPAGASAALALAEQGQQVALLDRARPASVPDGNTLDTRVVAISPGSMAFLDQIGASSHLKRERIAEYRSMRVCSGQQQLDFIAEEHGLEQLGWIIEIANLNDALWQAATHQRRLEIITPAEVKQFEIKRDSITLNLASGGQMSSQLVIGADGARSRVREAAGIDVQVDDYNQRAIVTQLQTSRPNQGMAWQRFTKHGPLALLPLSNQGSSLVWSMPFDQAEALMALDDADFLEALSQAADGQPFGPFTTISQRFALPLIRRQSERLHSGRFALVGDAARSVHPLAGQGMNLGLADAAELAHCLNGWDAKRDPQHRLARFARRRLSDSSMVATGIHFINESRIFGPVLSQLGMGAAFKLLSSSRLAREPFVQRACGLN